MPSMKRLATMTLAASVLAMPMFAGSAHAQSSRATATKVDPGAAAKAMLEKARDAMGGKKAFDKVMTIETNASLTMEQGGTEMEISFATYWGRAKEGESERFFASMDFGGMGGMKSGGDGKTYYATDMMTGGLGLASKDEAMAEQAAFGLMPFKLLEDDGETEFKLAGTEKFNGADCYKINAKSGGQEQDIFIDKKTMLPAGMKTEMQFGPASITFGKWKEFGDLKLFTEVNIDQMGTMKFTKIELNKVDDSKFALPDEVKKLAEKDKGKDK